MLKRIEKPTIKLARNGEEIKVKNWYVQGFDSADGEYYERAQQRGPYGIAFAEKWFKLDD